MTTDSANSNNSNRPPRSEKEDRSTISDDSAEDSKIIHIDQVVGNETTVVDYDLTDFTNADSSQIENPDICLDDGKIEIGSDDITYSKSRSLISRPGSEVAVARGREQLDRIYRDIWKRENYIDKRIIYPDMDEYEILNAFREVRTEIVRNAKQKNQIVMVVSLQHGMGATFSSVNLAAVFAYEGEKTALIVDCDQKRRKLEKIFPLDSMYGLSDYLEGDELGVEDVIYPTGIKRVRYLPMGHRPSLLGEFFTSTKTREFFVTLKNRYVDRYIILNAPPIEVSADAAILSELCDQIVIVVPYGKVSNSRLLKALRLLPRSKITGIVINNRINSV